MTDVQKHTLMAVLKFVPLLIFALLVILFGMDLLLAAPIATFAAAVVYMIDRRSGFSKAFEQGLRATKKIVAVFFILMFAYGVAECFMATGVGASLIIMALRLGVTAPTVAVLSLLITCLLSVATGSSWGTFAACAPILLWLTHLVGGDVTLTVCAVAGGSCFGDNIGLISDVTVLSCGMQEVEIMDRVRHQAVWSLGCLAVAMGIFYLAGMHMPSAQGDAARAIAGIPAEARAALAEQRPSALVLLQQVEQGVPMYMALPLIVVIAMSFFGCHTLLCLGAGMISSLLCGLLAGTTDFSTWLNGLLLTGFEDAGSWTVVMMMWVAAFGGIMNAMDAFDPLTKLVVKLSRNVHQLMGWCGVLCFLGNMALADESAQVATMSPIVRDVVEKNVDCTEDEAYTLRLRLATFTSSMGIYGSELVPWHCFPVFFASIAASVYPMYAFTPVDIIAKNYTAFLVIGSIFLLTFTGWDKFIPGFKLPKNATLKK